MWVTTLPCAAISTENFVELAHHRWDIENRCFNELSNTWHADHFYKYDFNAIQVIWLLIGLAYNIFHLFFYRNLKKHGSKKNVLNQITGEFFNSGLELLECGGRPLLT